MRGASPLLSGIVANSANFTATTPAVLSIGFGNGLVLCCARAAAGAIIENIVEIRIARAVRIMAVIVTRDGNRGRRGSGGQDCESARYATFWVDFKIELIQYCFHGLDNRASRGREAGSQLLDHEALDHHWPEIG